MERLPDFMTDEELKELIRIGLIRLEEAIDLREQTPDGIDAEPLPYSRAQGIAAKIIQASEEREDNDGTLKNGLPTALNHYQAGFHQTSEERPGATTVKP